MKAVVAAVVVAAAADTVAVAVAAAVVAVETVAIVVAAVEIVVIAVAVATKRRDFQKKARDLFSGLFCVAVGMAVPAVLHSFRKLPKDAKGLASLPYFIGIGALQKRY